MRQGGTLLALVLLISGVLRFAGPGAASSHSSDDSAATAKKKTNSHSAYINDLRETIQAFYGVWETDPTKAENLGSYWNVPDSQELTGTFQKITPHPRADVHFAVAILPDPLHTRLALLFDRGVEAIQEAAERKGYSFDRAIFPWDRNPVALSDDVDKRREAAEVQKAREEYPGLMIFRGRSTDGDGKPIAFPAPLFVFVVGESPTSGIRKKQFQNTIIIMEKIRDGNHTEPSGEDPPAKSRPLFVVGPYSSGSLRSLKRELNLLHGTETFVYSGSVTDFESMKDFTTPTDPAIHFASFQENDDLIRDRFVQFACKHDGYHAYEIATLSEGDTAYGSGVQNGPKPAAANQKDKDSPNPSGRSSPPDEVSRPPDDECSDSQLVRLRFPREISYFRAAYQDQTATQKSSSTDIPVPQSVPVTLNPEEIGTDDDAALPYAGAQTPANQEAVMLGIVGELNKHHIKFTILYASDPLDQFFLSRYLRTKYPRGRVVVTDPDLLLISQEDSSLRGVLGINTYPIVPGLSDTFCSFHEQAPPGSPISIPVHRHDDRLFVSSSSIGTFNAMLALLSESENADANSKAKSNGVAQTTTEMSALSTPAGVSSKPQTQTVAPSDGTRCEAVGNPSAKNPDEIVVNPVLPAPYAEYATPPVRILGSGPKGASCQARPLVWITMLGQDGFWPVVALSDRDLQTEDRNEPILEFKSKNSQSTNPDVKDLQIVPSPIDKDDKSKDGESKSDKSKNDKLKNDDSGAYKSKDDQHKTEDDDSHLHLPPAWKISYCFAVFLLVLHAFLSFNGSILADSEPRAQFARISDFRDVAVIGLGAFALATAFVTIMFSGGPVIGELGISYWFGLWLPLPAFVIITTYDLSKLRSQWRVASVFAASTLVMFVFETFVWLSPQDFPLFWMECSGSRPSCACWWLAHENMLHSALWSTRLLHYTSGVSPVLPILFLAAAGYWWMWQSLRGVTLVDKRRPRLPDREYPVGRWYRINEREAAELRSTAHPLFFKWYVVLVLVVVAVFLTTILDFEHPVQTVEGRAYDWIYTILLCLMVGTLIGILVKLVFTWLKCSQILSGLDRLPLREEFSRMKNLSWHSFWNPGGSTLRATYKVLQRGLDGLFRLRRALETVDEQAPVDEVVRRLVRARIKDVKEALDVVTTEYLIVVDPIGNVEARKKAEKTCLAEVTKFFRDVATKDPLPGPQKPLAELKIKYCRALADTLEKYMRESANLPALTTAVENMQMTMANAAAEIVERVLDPWWQCEKAPVVSEDERIKKGDLPLTRLLAEEFVALVYVNFLITVLLRMRTMVMAAIGMYVFIVLSMNVYPFEPHAALQTLAVVLLAVMGAAVAFVYAQMHRDPILSRLTSTTSGELGWDFWLKLASAGAIPVFSLLAVQFPEINRFLFSWLEPALQAVK
jgi:hypothetical protein